MTDIDITDDYEPFLMRERTAEEMADFDTSNSHLHAENCRVSDCRAEIPWEILRSVWRSTC
jgi:hypothetical protein